MGPLRSLIRVSPITAGTRPFMFEALIMVNEQFVLSTRSVRQRKAWGGAKWNPRISLPTLQEPAKRARAAHDE